MHNPRLAERYAKSLVALTLEIGQFDLVDKDIRLLHHLCTISREFVLMLKSPIITADKKFAIISKVTDNKISKTTQTFIKLLCNKNRESALPEIILSFIDQYNTIKGIHKAKLTTAIAVSEEVRQSFIQKIKEANQIDKIELETVVRPSLIGGFLLEMDGKMVDASILRDLNDVKRQFANNDYIHKLR
ncbi:MAG: ATP synthase F1 subunit delta [Bacteroidota bacterium]|nr:ATP synthase F1 subunit delta [Bacteroidota bacterium]